MSGSGATPADGVVRMVRSGLLTLVALVPLAGLAGHLVAGSRGLLGALLGLALPALVLAVTLGAALATRRSRPEVLAAAVLGSYLLKLVLVLAVLAVLRGLDGYDRPVLGVTALVGLAVALVVEAVAVTRAKTPYVDPVPSGTTGPSPETRPGSPRPDAPTAPGSSA